MWLFWLREAVGGSDVALRGDFLDLLLGEQSGQRNIQSTCNGGQSCNRNIDPTHFDILKEAKRYPTQVRKLFYGEVSGNALSPHNLSNRHEQIVHPVHVLFLLRATNYS